MAATGAGAGGGRGPGPRDMRLTMQEAAKKLSLWHSATFRPILTHDELEPILSAAGFAALPPAPRPPPEHHHHHQHAGAGAAATPLPWREYAFVGVAAAGRRNAAAAAGWLGPRPRLPYPRVDALHLRTYQAFLGAVEFYLGALPVAALFHVRCMPVTTAQDRVFDKVFRVMRNFGVEDDGLIVYRDGTLDDATFAVCSEHSPVQDVGYHVIPGNTCSELGYLKPGRIAGNCDEENCGRSGAARKPSLPNPAGRKTTPLKLEQ
ncbi:uncharacterized protein LOC107304748 [Oryza brachyantha]|uniref:uncharacterized protein LOC107304748 n=1 Tax=Oryza brachyantha TaxID=4533 RepID=UPI001ADB413F|nr:uncharacterized protein LOC107304748 [Oryza brachyantha]